jgi:hypothetical protein
MSRTNYTTYIESSVMADGRRKVFFMINRKWVHKGWLMPQIGGAK